MIRVAVVDNHEVVLEGVASRLHSVEDIMVTAKVESPTQLTADTFDVVLLDLWLDGYDSLDSIGPLVEAGATVLLHTSEDQPVQLRRAVDLGAAGLVLKDDPLDTVVLAIRSAAAAEFYCSSPLAHALLTDEQLVAQLSRRQVEILQCLSDGLDYRGVAQELDMSEGSVKTHLARARERFRRIGSEPGNALDLVRRARKQGFLRP